MAGTFTKKKKCKQSFIHCTYLFYSCHCVNNVKVWSKIADIVTGVCNDIPAWSGREMDDINEKRAYFGIKTTDRTIEFECGSKGDKQFWLDGIQYMLNCRVKVTL